MECWMEYMNIYKTKSQLNLFITNKVINLLYFTINLNPI